MRASRAITARALALGLLATAIGLGAGIAAARLVLRQAQREAVARVRELASELDACERAPERWSGAGEPETFAYDAATYRSANPAAPAYRGTRPLPIGQPYVRSGGTPFGPTTIALRMREHGPCAVLQRRWPRLAPAAVVQAVGASAVGLAMLGTLVVGVLLIVRPLLRGVSRVAAYASEIGRDHAASLAPDVGSDELQQIVDALARSHVRIVAAERQAGERLRALEQHLAEVAHDLRTPLTALQLCVEEALEQSEDATLHRTLTQALEESVYLAGLTENLRLTARLREAGRLRAERRQLDLRELLQRICSRLRVLARRKQMAFRADLGSEPVVSDCAPLAVERALSNVIENAVVHGRLGGRIEVRLRAAEGAFRLVVEDDGPGFDVASSTARAGSGLGMRITRQVADEVGWSVEIAALAADGTRATITGPCLQEANDPGRVDAP